MNFETKEDAISWMIGEIDDECIDNIRFSFLDDAEGVEQYLNQQDDGCCGFFDAEISVGGRLAAVGCNYGH